MTGSLKCFGTYTWTQTLQTPDSLDRRLFGNYDLVPRRVLSKLNDEEKENYVIVEVCLRIRPTLYNFFRN